MTAPIQHDQASSDIASEAARREWSQPAIRRFVAREAEFGSRSVLDTGVAYS